MWQWTSPALSPDTKIFPPLSFANIWYYDGPNKQLLLRTGSPNGSSFVLHKGITLCKRSGEQGLCAWTPSKGGEGLCAWTASPHAAKMPWGPFV